MPYDRALLWKLNEGIHTFGNLELEISSDGYRAIPFPKEAQKEIG